MPSNLTNCYQSYNQTPVAATRIQQALFEYVTDSSVSILSAAVAHDLNPSSFHRIVVFWRRANQGVVPTSPSSMVVTKISAGRPRAFSAHEEDLIAKTILGFAVDDRPLTINLVQQVNEHYLQRYAPADRSTMFKNGLPSRGWVTNFIARREDLRTILMRYIENRRMDAIT